MILAKVFYDNNIHTTGELLSALISIEKQTDMKISAEKDEDGNYRPETVRIEFDNKDVNMLLSQYLTYKDRNDSEDTFELERLILTDTPYYKNSGLNRCNTTSFRPLFLLHAIIINLFNFRYYVLTIISTNLNLMLQD